MNSNTHQSTTVEIASGGLVWADSSRAKLCVVHRPHYNDWVLPKGRPEPGEAMDQTALREAQEETGMVVTLGDFAGFLAYSKNGAQKVVLVWHMVASQEHYSNKAGPGEIDDIQWLTPEDAIAKMTHPNERALVARHSERPTKLTVKRHLMRKPELDRLAAWVITVRERFAAHASRPQPSTSSWWVDPAARSLKSAEDAIVNSQLDAGWAAVHNAERFMVFGMEMEELLPKAIIYNIEAKQKLKAWRAESIKQMFENLPLAELCKPGKQITGGDLVRLRYAVVNAMEIFHGHSDNAYHRMYLVERQLKLLVKACGALLASVFTLSYYYAPETDFSILILLPVALSGALGGVVSAMYQLSRVGQSKIPEALLHGIVTSGRPLVGAAAALFIYVALKSELITVVDSASISLGTSLVLAFVSGFSEQFVLTTVAKVSGSDKEQPQK
jgi:8-oxo-dGTP diphosphatase